MQHANFTTGFVVDGHILSYIIWTIEMQWEINDNCKIPKKNVADFIEHHHMFVQFCDPIMKFVVPSLPNNLIFYAYKIMAAIDHQSN